MKIIRAFCLSLLVLLASCLFKEPVFTSGFSKIDGSLTGLWQIQEGDNSGKADTAVCLPLDDERYLLHYPANDEKGGMYHELRPLRLRDRDVLQVRSLGTVKGEAPDANDEKYTVVWLEKKSATEMNVRALKGAGAERRGAAATRRLLEDPAADWQNLFGDAVIFKRLND